MSKLEQVRAASCGRWSPAMQDFQVHVLIFAMAFGANERRQLTPDCGQLESTGFF
jgi:hypothetical protein